MLPSDIPNIFRTATFQNTSGWIPAGLYLPKVNIENSRVNLDLCSKLAKRTPGQYQFYYTNFEHVIVLWLLLSKRFFRIRQMFSWKSPLQPLILSSVNTKCLWIRIKIYLNIKKFLSIKTFLNIKISLNIKMPLNIEMSLNTKTWILRYMSNHSLCLH